MNDKAVRHNANVHNKVYKKYNLKHSEIYNKHEQGRLNSEVKKLVAKVKSSKVEVLDFGAGTGNLSLKFLKNECRVCATDVSLKSLKLLKQISGNNKELKLKLLENKEIPFKDNTFDITTTYSVLHHIPDYLFAVREMIRVTKKGGYIFMDHEGNWNSNPNKSLKQYQKLTHLNRWEYVKMIFRTREVFTFEFLKAVFIKLFIDKKYQREGDIHVFEDDHIEWDKIKKILKENNCKIVDDKDHLLYIPRISIKQYNYFKEKCNDTKMLIAQKL